MCSCIPEGQSYPGVHQKQCGQWVEGDDSCPLFHFHETPSVTLPPALESSAQEGLGPVEASAEEGYKDNQRAGAPLLCRRADRAGMVHPGEDSKESSLQSFNINRGLYKNIVNRLFSKSCSNWTMGNGFKLKEGIFRLETGNVFTLRVVKH